MQQKLEALFHKGMGRTLVLSVALTGALVLGGLGIGSAMAAAPDASQAWFLNINGQTVAAAADEDTLVQLYEEAVDSYRTDSVTSLKVLSAVQIHAENAPMLKNAGTTPESTKTYLLDKLSVQTVSTVTETAEIPYETVTVEDDSLYTDESYTEEGHVGEQTTTYEIVSINGTEKLRKQTGTATTVEPENEVVHVGTRERNEFVWPAHGNYTGNYGIDTINGANRKHAGIDIAGASGSDICAARAGTVVYAGWDNGGYGNLVVIEHDNGTHTYYAHNSSIYVSVGQTVEQGETIAAMGATGRVTGVHCHFEVRLGSFNGLYIADTTDPMNYLDLNDL